MELKLKKKKLDFNREVRQKSELKLISNMEKRLHNGGYALETGIKKYFIFLQDACSQNHFLHLMKKDTSDSYL